MTRPQHTRPLPIAALAPKRRAKPSLPSFLSMDRVADALGVSKKTVERRIQAGELRSHRIGRQIRVSEEDFQAYVAAFRR